MNVMETPPLPLFRYSYGLAEGRRVRAHSDVRGRMVLGDVPPLILMMPDAPVVGDGGGGDKGEGGSGYGGVYPKGIGCGAPHVNAPCVGGGDDGAQGDGLKDEVSFDAFHGGSFDGWRRQRHG